MRKRRRRGEGAEQAVRGGRQPGEGRTSPGMVKGGEGEGEGREGGERERERERELELELGNFNTHG